MPHTKCAERLWSTTAGAVSPFFMGEGQKAGVDDSAPELAFTPFRKKPGRIKSFGGVTAFTSSQRKNLKTPNSAQ